MDCREIQQRLRHDPADPTVDGHLATCLDCARVAAEAAGLAAFEAPFPADLGSRVQAALAAERGPRAWLRSRPTPLRVALAGSVAIAAPLWLGLRLLRPDLAIYPAWRWIGVLVVLAGLLGAGLHLALRPLDRPVRRGVVWAGAAALLAFSVAPAAHAHGKHGDPVVAAVVCLVLGVAAGLPALLAIRLVDRGHGSALAALAAGAGGYLALHLLCPIPDPSHLLAGHFGAFLVLNMLRR